MVCGEVRDDGVRPRETEESRTRPGVFSDLPRTSGATGGKSIPRLSPLYSSLQGSQWVLAPFQHRSLDERRVFVVLVGNVLFQSVFNDSRLLDPVFRSRTQDLVHSWVGPTG